MNIKIAINVCRVCLKSGIGTSLYTEPNFVEKFRYSTQIKVFYYTTILYILVIFLQI